MAFYGTVAKADTYHSERGNAAWAALPSPSKQAALTRGSQYVDQRYRVRLHSGRWVSLFSGTKTGDRSQVPEWPRTDAVDYEGNEIPANTVPIEVEWATYEAALREAASPGSLSPDFVPSDQVISVTVGPITEKYANAQDLDSRLPNRPIVPAIDEIIAPVLVARSVYPAVRVV